MRLSRRWVVGAVCMLGLLFGSLRSRAQEISGSISGTVLDSNGASVSGALVTITNTDRSHVEREIKTDKAGLYTAPSLPLGTYSVSVSMKGFKTSTITGIVLNANAQLTVNQKLAVGAATESLTIVADQANVNLENGQSMGLVTGTQIRELVLNNRNYEQLLTLQPGVSYGGTSDQLYIGASLPSGTSAQVAFSINGDRSTANNWTIDGADNVDRGANLTLLDYPSVDAIAEFNTLRGTYKAEYGRSASGQINVITRSGTNAFHGGAYEFFRNDALNANDYFNKLTPVAATPTSPKLPYTPRPPLRYNDFGFTLGGPIVIPHLYNGKDKAFFFYSQEFRRVVNYAIATALVPTADERNGDFSNSYVSGGTTAPVAVCQTFDVSSGSCTGYTTNLAGSKFLSPAALAYIKDIYSKVPLPNSASNIAAGLDPHLITNNIRNIFNDNQEFARIDYALTKKTNVFYRYLHDDLPSTEGGGLFIGGGMPGVSNTSTRAPGTQHMGHVTIATTPTLLFDLGYAYSSGAIISTPTGYANSSISKDVTAAVTLPYPVTLGIVPSLNFADVTGVSSGGVYNDFNRNHNGFGDITKTVGRHTFKFGMSYNHYQKVENALGNGSPYPQGRFTFNQAATPSASTLTSLGTNVKAPSAFDSEWANFLIGNASGGFSQGSAALTPNINENLIELYGQDDWKATRNLTVNLGVRYSWFGQPYDAGNELTNFDPETFNQIDAQTISSNGNLCTTAGQTTFVTSFTSSGVVTTYTLNNCPNVNGLNAYQPNAGADPLNGIIIGNPDFISAQNKSGSTSFPFSQPSGAPSIDSHASPFGQQVGHSEKHDWAPRVGFAWDVFGDGRTALRGGYGIAYDESQVSIYEQAVFSNPPFLCQSNYTSAELDVPTTNSTTLAGPCASGAPPALRATPVIYQTPYVQQFSLDLQRQITPTMILDVGYFGDHGTHLQGVVDINQVRPAAFLQTSIGYSQVAGCQGFTSSSCEAPLNQIRPYQGYTAINAVQTIFNQNYNGLQAKFTKRFAGKSLIDVNYTWSRGLTNAQTDYSSAPQNTYNLSAEYGPTAYNRNDILNVDGVWELPWMRDQKGIVGKVLGGWEVSGIYALNSGLPLTVTMSGGGTINYGGLTSVYNGQANGGLATDAAGLAILGPSASSLRPDMVLNPNSGYNQTQLHTRLHWFNQTAFVAPPIASYRVGNEKRGVVNGPGFQRFDFGLFRTFNIWRGSTFTLRGEGFNVFNHTNFVTINTTATSSTFGQASADRGPRLLQVGGKFNF